MARAATAVSQGQVALFGDPRIPEIPGIDLRCCGIEELMPLVSGVHIVHADPPWRYKSKGVPRGGSAGINAGDVEEQYDDLSNDEIVAHVDASYDCALTNAYLLLWCTWPKLREWFVAEEQARQEGRFRWTYLSGGSWDKTGGAPGIGYHWRGECEPILLYKKGKARPYAKEAIGNAYHQVRGDHSDKPVEFLELLVNNFSPLRKGRVLDLYAGRGSMAKACLATGRSYWGAEIDSERHGQALGGLASRQTSLLLKRRAR